MLLAVDLWREAIPEILDMLLQIAFTSQHVADFGWVPFSELGD